MNQTLMERHQFEKRIKDLKDRAHGRWPAILSSLGVEENILKRRNLPCPSCGGTDRFQFTDKYGDGNYICRKCGTGDGISLLQVCRGWDFSTTCKCVENYLGTNVAPTSFRPGGSSSTQAEKLVERIWSQSLPLKRGDAVDCYLRRRGLHLASYPQSLRFHPALGYYEKDRSGNSKKLRDYPAMVACIRNATGNIVSLHRTYLEDGKKACGSDSKKILNGGINGAAIHLFEVTDELAIAEGIETALAIHLGTGKPVWSALNAGNLEKIWIPRSVKRVRIYADNDSGSWYDGQVAAYALARRLKKEESGQRDVQVFVPKQAGSDWADVWLSRLVNENQAA